jgi:hypothetical protein
VDISPACIAIARRNVAAYGPERIDPARVELVLGDAAEFDFPPDPLVVYLYNPFPEAVLERVVGRLEASLRLRPRACALIYVNPHALAAVAASALFERLPTIAERMPAAALGTARHEGAAVFVTRGWPGPEAHEPGARAASAPVSPG